MKITQLDIEGFRSLKNVSWKPGNLNVIIGANGSGKSNLLRLLELISASSKRGLDGFIQSSGGMAPLIWDGQAGSILWRLSFAALNSPSYELKYDVELMREGFTSSYHIRGENLDHHEFSGDGAKSSKQLSRHLLKARLYDEDGKPQDLPDGAISAQETLLSLVAGPLTPNHWFDILQQYLSGWAVYQDLRVDRGATLRQPAISRLERAVVPDGQNLINALHTLYTGDREFKRQVNLAMFAAFGDDFEELNFQPDRGDQRIQMRVRWKTLANDQSAADLSDGTLRFLFLIAVLASPNPAPLIAIDEPETGLHPSMLPIVAELAVDAAERTQVIFTTHSDQFLDAFRETGVRPTTTVARWENGESTLTTLADEDLAYWLKDYSLGKMFRSGELESLA